MYFADQWDPKSPWHDRRVRLAANHASDRHAINKAESRGYSRITGSIIPATFDFYWGPPVSPYDPARAKKLLAEAGYPNGFDAGEYFCDAVLQPRRERDHLSQGGRHPGEASAPRAGGLLQGYSEKKLKNLIQGASGAFGNASARIEAFVASGGAYVYGSYDDLDGLFREQAAEMDTKRRGATLRHLQQLIHEKAMFAPIWEDRRPQRRRPASGGLRARTHRRLPILGPVRACQAQGQVRLALRYYSWPRTGCRRVNPSQTRGELVMPVYEHFCDKCEREVQLTLSIRDHDKEPMTRYLEPNARRNRSALVSVVVPALNEERNLPHLFERLCSVFEGAGWRFELILVDDGSTDGTLAVMKEMRSRDARVRYVSLSRNFGHQAALLAGLKHAQGDVVVSMDADLQHPPETIPRMLALWLEGYDVVHTRKRSDLSAPLFRRVIAKLFYKSFNMLSDVQLVFGESDFRLQDAHVVRELCRIPEHDKFLRGLVEWLGFRQSNLDYDVPPRFAECCPFPSFL